MTGPPIRVLELRSVRGTGGGPEKTILLGAAHADRRRCAVTVCYIRDRRDRRFELDRKAAELAVDYAEVHERTSFDPGIWRQLRRLVAERRINIVHTHEYKTDLVGYLLARRLGIAAVATAHGWTGQSMRERWCYYPADKAILARFPKVIAVSNDIRNDLVRHGARPERIEVLLNSIDVGAHRRDPLRRAGVRRALGLPENALVIGAVGRLERQKRFDVLLEAVAALAARNSMIRLVIAGHGALGAELEPQARALGIADLCLWLGHRTDVADLHNAFDLFVQSSEYEGTPNAVLEAMAMETPIVATDAGGTREVVEPRVHGLIVPARSPDALVDGIREALDDGEGARTRAVAARRRVEADLSFEARTRRLETIYAELVAERVRVPPATSAEAGVRRA